MTDVPELLDVLESQLMGIAASASAAASIARMVRESISGGAQGADAEEGRSPMAGADDIVTDNLLLPEKPRTFGDGRRRRRQTTEE